VALELINESDGERWPVAVRSHGAGLSLAFTADIDCDRAANGKATARRQVEPPSGLA
jgi:hypothetical protein